MSSPRLTAVLCFAAALAAAKASSADPSTASAVESARGENDRPLTTPSVSPADEASEPPVAAEPRSTRTGRAVSAGAFLPFTVGASSDATYGTAASGYDGARRAIVYEGTADAHVIGGLSVRAGYASHDLWGRASAVFASRYQLLSQKRHGIDLGVALAYLPQNIEGEGLVKASLLVGRNLGQLGLFSSMSYGQDSEGDDHQAELAVGTLYPLVPAVFVGADARARMLVFSSDTKHGAIAQPVVDVAAGPLAHYVLGPMVLTSQVGVSALATEGPGSLRAASEMRYGMLALITVGFSL